MNENKLREHIQEHHVVRKQEAIKLAVEVKRPDHAPVKKKWAFHIPTYHPYRRNSSRKSSIAPFVGQEQSRETSVAVDYSTWGFGDRSETAMAIAPYGQAATITIAFPTPCSIPGTPESGNATPYAQYNTSALPAPPSYNPRSTPEQLQAQLTKAIQMLSERQEQSASLQPIYPRINFIANVQASASFGPGFNPMTNTFGPLAPQPLLQLQNDQYAPFAHHGLGQGQIQEFLAQIEQKSPFRDPFPGAAWHPDGWVVSAMNRRERLDWEWGRGLATVSTVVPTSHGSTVVGTLTSHGQSKDDDRGQGGQEEETVLESVERDEDEQEEYDPETFELRW